MSLSLLGLIIVSHLVSTYVRTLHYPIWVLAWVNVPECRLVSRLATVWSLVLFGARSFVFLDFGFTPLDRSDQCGAFRWKFSSLVRVIRLGVSGDPVYLWRVSGDLAVLS
jgi:hypothetical protein